MRSRGPVARQRRYACSTTNVAPSARTTRTCAPAGALGPVTRQEESSTRIRPLASTIGVSKVKTRPTSAWPRRLRADGPAFSSSGWRVTARPSSTEAAERIAKQIAAACQLRSKAQSSTPAATAASPSQSRKTPGARSSSPIKARPRTIQDHGPRLEKKAATIAAASGLGRRRQAAALPRQPARAGLAEHRAGHLGDTAQRAGKAAELGRDDQHLLVRGGGERPDGVDVLLGDEEVRRREIAAGDRLADHGGRLGFGLGEALAGFGVAERRFLAALGRENLRLLVALGLEDRGLAQALGLEHGGALLALGLHLARHGAGKVGRRQDVLDLDAGDLDAPGRGGGAHDAQEAVVDLVAMREELVEVHRADDGADIGHR